MKESKFFFSSLLTIFASIATTFIVAYAFFKFAGPVPISVSQTTIEKKNTFNVIGEGKISVIPDIAEITLGIKTEKETVAEAQKQANQVINKIEKALTNFKIDNKDIKTGNYQIYPNYDYSSKKRKIRGYSVNTNLKIKVRNFKNINKVIDTAVNLGANQIGGLNFSVDEKKLEKYKNQARKEAIQKAKEKAKSLTKIANIKLGKIINLQENYQTPRPYYNFPIAGGGEATAVKEETKIQPGSTEVSVTITLSYELL